MEVIPSMVASLLRCMGSMELRGVIDEVVAGVAEELWATRNTKILRLTQVRKKKLEKRVKLAGVSG